MFDDSKPRAQADILHSYSWKILKTFPEVISLGFMALNNQAPPSTEESSALSKLNPFKQLNVITKAIKAVPAVKWALGVAGVLAALSLGLMFFKSAPAAIAGAIRDDVPDGFAPSCRRGGSRS